MRLNGNQCGMLKPQQRLPAKWQRHASSLESVSKPMCVFFMRHHTQIFTFTDSRNIYSYIFLISTFGRKNGVGRDSVRHQLKPAAVTFIDHNANLTPTVQLFYFHQLIAGVFSADNLCCVLVYYYLRQGRSCDSWRLLVCLFVYLLEK